ncbi:MAG TPA: hypothetical protein VGN93_04520 [Shinella sp.]|jgi:hypothetical protein|uniref:hypothetical protein n=1 Tax=Shinella sp. TaxID=1870904 RepID=UPI002E11B325|nr:hypothetical protein [Shinella sp.]
MTDEIAEAAAYFLSVCREHDRLFPLRNILVAVQAYQAADDKDQFVADVRFFLEPEKGSSAGD